MAIYRVLDLNMAIYRVQEAVRTARTVPGGCTDGQDGARTVPGGCTDPVYRARRLYGPCIQGQMAIFDSK